MRRFRDWFDLALARDEVVKLTRERDAARRMTVHCREQRDLFSRRWQQALTLYEEECWQNDALSAELRRLGKDPSKVLEAADRANGGRLKWVQAKDWTEPKEESA